MSPLDQIALALSSRLPTLEHPAGRRQAAVAVVIRIHGNEAEFLYIRRAERSGDPWSGHLAFPGGKVDSRDVTARAAAERETREEIGLDLSGVRFLGRLDDSVTTYNRAHVSGFVYHLLENVDLWPNGEIQSTHWTALPILADPSRRLITSVKGVWGERQVPAIKLLEATAPVLWGLTYRMTAQLLRFVGVHLPEVTPAPNAE